MLIYKKKAYILKKVIFYSCQLVWWLWDRKIILGPPQSKQTQLYASKQQANTDCVPGSQQEYRPAYQC